MIIDGDVAAAVDPQRDIDRIEALLAERRLRLTHVFETHVHNDYVTGGLRRCPTGRVVRVPVRVREVSRRDRQGNPQREVHVAELEEEEQNVDRLRRWHRELRARDVLDAVDGTEVQLQLDECAAARERFTTLVYAVVAIN